MGGRVSEVAGKGPSLPIHMEKIGDEKGFFDMNCNKY